MLNGCKVGDAKLTRGYRLPARHVIHTVGPVWQGGDNGEPALLASCYRRSLEIAYAHGLATVAFPGISTGIYRYPARLAADVAIGTIVDFLTSRDLPQQVILCAFDAIATQIVHDALLAAAE